MKHTHIHVHGDLAEVFAQHRTQDDWAKWNAEHKERGLKHKAIVDNKLVGKSQTALHAAAAEAHAKAHHAITAGKHEEATQHAMEAEKHEFNLRSKHGYLPKSITHSTPNSHKGKEAYLNGSKGVHTGNTLHMSGGKFHEIEMHEGPHKGKKRVIAERHTQDLDSYKRDREGKFSTSSGTGEQHAATSEIHTAHAERKGTDHKDYPHHVAAAEAHKKAAAFLSQANKAQHPGAAIEAERHAKAARLHENTINKGRGSDPAGEVARQNKAMSDPRVMKENRERNAELDKKHPAKGAKKSKTKDEAPCGCGGTADAGFDESKHPRDHGKFSTMGHAGGSLDHHITRMEYHEKQQAASQFGDKRQAHANAALHHQKAAHHIANAYSHHALGDKEGADKQHMLAQHHANQASRHEGTSGFPSPLKEKEPVANGTE